VVGVFINSIHKIKNPPAMQRGFSSQTNVYYKVN